MITHRIKLDGPGARGARLSVHVLRVLSELLVETAQRSLRLRVDGRSNLQGKAAWLDAAVSMDLVGLGEGSTVTYWEAPTLAQAVPDILNQLPLWDGSPRPDQTALSIVQEVLRDAASGNAESDVLDYNILGSVSDFERLFEMGFQSLEMDGASGEPARLTLADTGRARELQRGAPRPERVVVSGYLDELVGSKRSFSLLLPGGQRVRGLLPEENSHALSALWTRRVVVDGEAHFRPSGGLSVVAATHIQEAGPGADVWARVPRPRPRDLTDLRPRATHGAGENPTAGLLGQWPGDETQDELFALLREIEGF